MSSNSDNQKSWFQLNLHSNVQTFQSDNKLEILEFFVTQFVEDERKIIKKHLNVGGQEIGLISIRYYHATYKVVSH